MKHLSIHLDTDAVVAQASAASKKTVFALLSQKAAHCYDLDAKQVAIALIEREALGSTGFGGSVAIPHAKIPGLESCVGVFLRLAKPIGFDAHDDQPVDLIFGLFSPKRGGVDHLKALAEISRFLRDSNMLAKLRGATSGDALYTLLAGQNEQQAA